MNRQEALDWLNYRLDLENKMGRNNHFTITDLEFFMYFVKDQTGKDVHINKFIYSIKHHSESCMDWVEKLINYLVYTHNIEVITDNRVDTLLNFHLGISEDSCKILKYK